MFDNLTALGYGIITFAILIGVGSIILYEFGGSQACDALYTWNSTSNVCIEDANLSHSVSPSGTTYTNTNYLLTELGSTGLAGWTPAIVAISVGMLFLGMFMVKGSRKY